MRLFALQLQRAVLQNKEGLPGLDLLTVLYQYLNHLPRGLGLKLDILSKSHVAAAADRDLNGSTADLNRLGGLLSAGLRPSKQMKARVSGQQREN
ncbi:hypothetical protein kuro4_22820 [Gelria sp. Kuro-4]|nr:hypothetical protein kuro4_22820 [Gelria sp. Kuro-4]